LTVEDTRPAVGEHADRPGTRFTVRFTLPAQPEDGAAA
jgi:hypothetical protein